MSDKVKNTDKGSNDTIHSVTHSLDLGLMTIDPPGDNYGFEFIIQGDYAKHSTMIDEEDAKKIIEYLQKCLNCD